MLRENRCGQWFRCGMGNMTDPSAERSIAQTLLEMAEHIELAWEKQLPTSPHVATALRTLADEVERLEKALEECEQIAGSHVSPIDITAKIRALRRALA